MSLKPAIGKTWFDEFETDCYPSDESIIKGKKTSNPKYYDTLYATSKGEKALQKIKRARIKKAKLHSEDQTPQRLRVREICAKAKLKLKGRQL